MKSWTYFIQLVGRNKNGDSQVEGALYVVAVPTERDLTMAQKFSCFSERYLPEENAVNYGKAFAVSVDFEIEQPERYDLAFHREEDDLYIFKENISMKEGLKRVYAILMDELKSRGYGDDFDTVMDMGNPSENFMRECLLEAIKNP